MIDDILEHSVGKDHWVDKASAFRVVSPVPKNPRKHCYAQVQAHVHLDTHRGNSSKY